MDNYGESAGTNKGHYFHQDLLVASYVHQRNPSKHIDVASRVDGLVAHIASFREIIVMDIRSLPQSEHSNIRYLQGDLMERVGPLRNSCDSLSCLHALEHFGLGRYGDPLDPDGHIKGFNNLVEMLQPGGTLYISFPIGRRQVHFNAHRVFDPEEILEWIKPIPELKIVQFDYVDDYGDLNLAQDLSMPLALRFGCGIYTLTKANEH